MTGTAAQSVVLCEGFHDRSFWKGLLERLGCKDQRVDPFGSEVKGRGQFGFRTPSGRFIRVAPCFGDDKVLSLIEPELRGRSTKPLEWLVVNLDSDAQPGDEGAVGARVQAVVDRFRTQGEVTRSGPTHYVLADTTNLGVALWGTPDAADPALPGKQTLERLVCAAMLEAFPSRARAVESWLAQRPEPEVAGCRALHEKAFAWSHMAGWYSERGCDEFYQGAWAEEALARPLERRMRQTGVWDLVEALVA
jgi:hypothetical protein